MDKTLFIKITPELKTQLERLAAEAGLPLQVYLRMVCEQHGRTPMKIELRRRAS